MKMKSFEKDVVNKVVDYIKTNYDDEVEVLGKRIGLWRFRELKERLPNFHFQPDIDILLGPRIITQGRCRVTGVEVKTVYVRKDNELNVRFYKGLDEAIALLRFGLDNVVFFQVFLMPLVEVKERDKMLDVYFSYSEPMRDIIRTLNVPVSYTPSFDYLINNELSPNPIQVLDLRDPSRFPEDKHIILRSKAKNPFLNSQLKYPRVIRSFILSKYVKNL